jgi:hypothetical protein
MSEPKVRTLAQLAQEALDVQGACNLSGVVLGWGRAITELRRNLPQLGTDEINRHPINRLWADKVAHLTGTQVISGESMATFSKAYDVVCELAGAGK